MTPTKLNQDDIFAWMKSEPCFYARETINGLRLSLYYNGLGWITVSHGDAVIYHGKDTYGAVEVYNNRAASELI